MEERFTAIRRSIGPRGETLLLRLLVGQRSIAGATWGAPARSSTSIRKVGAVRPWRVTAGLGVKQIPLE